MGTPLIWYVTYGSNTLPDRFHAYLHGSDHNGEYGSHAAALSPALPVRDTWLWMNHALYFAGVSKRWTGSSAFVSLDIDATARTAAHAYLIHHEQFAHVAAGENAVDQVSMNFDVPVDSFTQLQFDHDGLPHRGKYDALLRLLDIDGTPAMTLTSSIVRRRGLPSDRYLATIRRGLETSALTIDLDGYLRNAVQRSADISMQRRK